MKVIDTRPASVAEAKMLLAQRSKDSELEYEQLQAYEHAEKFSHRTPEATEKIAKELMAKKETLDLEVALKLADLNPKRPETLKAALLRKRIEISDEEAEELLKILK